MAEIDLSNLEIAELKQLSEQIDHEIDKRHKQAKIDVLKQMQEAASRIGMTPEEVLGLEAAKKTKTKGKARYRNPEDPRQTWTGKGKRPGWIKDMLENGRTLEDMEIG